MNPRRLLLATLTACLGLTAGAGLQAQPPSADLLQAAGPPREIPWDQVPDASGTDWALRMECPRGQCLADLDRLYRLGEDRLSWTDFRGAELVPGEAPLPEGLRPTRLYPLQGTQLLLITEGDEDTPRSFSLFDGQDFQPANFPGQPLASSTLGLVSRIVAGDPSQRPPGIYLTARQRLVSLADLLGIPAETREDRWHVASDGDRLAVIPSSQEDGKGRIHLIEQGERGPRITVHEVSEFPEQMMGATMSSQGVVLMVGRVFEGYNYLPAALLYQLSSGETRRVVPQHQREPGLPEISAYSGERLLFMLDPGSSALVTAALPARSGWTPARPLYQLAPSGWKRILAGAGELSGVPVIQHGRILVVEAITDPEDEEASRIAFHLSQPIVDTTLGVEAIFRTAAD